MKHRIVTVILLSLCFAWLALAAEAIPVRTGAAAADSAGAPGGEALPPPSPSSAEESPSPTHPEEIPDSSSPLPTVLPFDELINTESPTPRPLGREAAAVTITAEDPLDNDTYYNIDPAELSTEEFCLPLPGEGYQILILHTHTTEAYTPTEGEPYETEDEYHTTDPEHSVVRVGEALARALEGYGLRVLHDETIHDWPGYSGSYARSGETAEEYLAAYPDIALIIDLHRDALGDGDTIYKTLADVDGLEAAQLMFVVGTDVNLEHPGWRDNLTLALTLQEAVAARYPTLLRPIVISSSRYNQQLSPGALLLEVGTSGNTLEEAITGVELFARAAGPLLASWAE